MWLSRYAKFVSASTILLIVAGGLVTSTGSGLSVPDWPTSYGWSMFTFPLKNMVGGIFYEHGHRLIASSVGFFTIVLAFWLWRAEPRPFGRGTDHSRFSAGVRRTRSPAVDAANRHPLRASRGRVDRAGGRRRHVEPRLVSPSTAEGAHTAGTAARGAGGSADFAGWPDHM